MVTIKSFKICTFLCLIVEGCDSRKDTYLNVWQLVRGNQGFLFVVWSLAMVRGDLSVGLGRLISQHLR